VQLSAEQRRELQNAHDHHPKPYVLERSAALVQMAEGKSPHWVATHGVLKPRKPDTLYRWVNWYQTQELAGLLTHQQGGPVRRRLVSPSSLGSVMTRFAWKSSSGTRRRFLLFPHAIVNNHQLVHMYNTPSIVYNSRGRFTVL
jgi:hypothetical protein